MISRFDCKEIEARHFLFHTFHAITHLTKFVLNVECEYSISILLHTQDLFTLFSSPHWIRHRVVVSSISSLPQVPTSSMEFSISFINNPMSGYRKAIFLLQFPLTSDHPYPSRTSPTPYSVPRIRNRLQLHRLVKQPCLDNQGSTR